MHIFDVSAEARTSCRTHLRGLNRRLENLVEHTFEVSTRGITNLAEHSFDAQPEALKNLVKQTVDVSAEGTKSLVEHSRDAVTPPLGRQAAKP